MPEPLKNMYNDAFFKAFGSEVESSIDGFDKSKFTHEVQSNGWEDLELKQRMRRISEVLRNHLDSDYKQSLKQIIQIIKRIKSDSSEEKDQYGFEYMFFPDYVELYGADDHLSSIKALTSITQFASCEFAVRPYIISHSDLMLKQMMKWAVHKNRMVRRLASEGFRPRLPWGVALSEFKKDPSPLLPMLELLRNDEAETVRRSVANNLNDIAKDHPDFVIQYAQKFIGESIETDKLIKHACRTLLKAGNENVMKLFGLGPNKNIKATSLNILNKNIAIGDYLEFSFGLENTSKSYILVRLEYAVYYQKANGTLTKKVYKISEKEYPGNTVTNISRKQSFKPISTRKFHVGKHQLALVINGKEMEKIDFTLTI